jgi:hypothetical protein
LGELDRTAVSIRFSGIDLDPKKLSEILCFVESNKTETTIKRTKKGIINWSISLNNKKSISLEEKIEELLTNFTADIEIWARVSECFDADIFCGLFLDSWNEGFILTPKLLNEISNRNLEIGFDVYSSTDSWDK